MIDWTRFEPIPYTSLSRSGSLSSTSRVLSPKAATICLERTGPIFLIRPEARYFSIPGMSEGRRSVNESALNVSPYLGVSANCPEYSAVIPSRTAGMIPDTFLTPEGVWSPTSAQALSSL